MLEMNKECIDERKIIKDGGNITAVSWYKKEGNDDKNVEEKNLKKRRKEIKIDSRKRRKGI